MGAVADRRFDDAVALSQTGKNARANGTVYLAGFVIEILLKAQLARRYGSIARTRQHELKKLSDSEKEIWYLVWRSHDLDGMLSKLREVESALMKQGERDGRPYLEELRKICSAWTIQARYSSYVVNMDEAKEFIDMVRSVKEKLR